MLLLDTNCASEQIRGEQLDLYNNVQCLYEGRKILWNMFGFKLVCMFDPEEAQCRSAEPPDS